MPARAAISSRLAAATPFSATTASVAATSAARVRSRLPPAFKGSGIDMRGEYPVGIKYSRYISYLKPGHSAMTLIATADAPRARSAVKTSAAPPIGRLYEVGGRRFALDRRGSGGPSVVFLPGAGLIGLDFLNIHEAIARVTTSVVYDRAGTGWSDAIRLPRSAADAAEELRALLEVAGVPPPYILVGHSLGGAYIRRFAQLFPQDVAGLLFLDPAHEGYATMPGLSLIG